MDIGGTLLDLVEGVVNAIWGVKEGAFQTVGGLWNAIGVIIGFFSHLMGIFPKIFDIFRIFTHYIVLFFTNLDVALIISEIFLIGVVMQKHRHHPLDAGKYFFVYNFMIVNYIYRFILEFFRLVFNTLKAIMSAIPPT